MLGLDYQIIVTNIDSINVPDSIDEQYEFILIDFECDDAEQFLTENENILENYHWILLHMQSSEVRVYFISD